ncbi:hypothetical protein GCM10023235_37660 [Kitasatospora terrestris]|uniref:Uncharacterized protein n=1 Tax=Kitasatospora terrestris TaxID=258051 RepID=A0ABP9DU63_9ACTN
MPSCTATIDTTHSTGAGTPRARRRTSTTGREKERASGAVVSAGPVVAVVVLGMRTSLA